MNLEAARELVIKICRLAWRGGCMVASDGNISLRLGDGRVLITPSGSSKALLEADELVEMDMEGRALAGGRPSTEALMHLAAYRLRPEVGAVVHAHPPYVNALSAAGRDLDPGISPEVLVGLGRAPTAPYATPGSPELARLVEPYLREHDAVILAHHGALTLGPDLETAWVRTEKLESAALVQWAAQGLGGARPLPPAEQERLLALGGRAGAEDPRPLAERVEHAVLPLTDEFLVEKRWQDERGQAHLIVDGRPLQRVCLLTLAPGAGYRGGHVHRRKHEGLYVVQGRARVELVCERSGERLELDLGPGRRLWIPPGAAHRIEALEPLTFVEFADRAYEAADDIGFEF